MSRVVPSQVVTLIDRLFPNAKTAPDFLVYRGNAPELSAIVRLVDEIPPELITLSGADYSDLVLAIEALTDRIKSWIGRGGDDPPRRINEMSPVAVIRNAMVKCPDSSPAPSTSELPFVSDVVLRESIRNDISAAASSLHNGEWKGATVLAGAAAEALLLVAIQSPSVQPALAALATKPSGAPEKWDLAGYIGIAEQLGIIEQNTAVAARLAKDFRNLIHPGRAQRTGEFCDRATALTALAAVALIVRDLS